MRRRSNRAAPYLSVLLLLILIPGTQSGFSKDADRFADSTLNNQRATGRFIDLDIRVKAYTSDEQIAEYEKLLEGSDQATLARSLRSTDVGRMSSLGEVGDQIAIARRVDTPEGGQVVTLITAQRILSVEIYSVSPAFATKYLEYPFSLIELRLDKKGRGEGLVMAAVKLHFTKDGLLETERLGSPSPPNVPQLVNVRRWN